VYGVVFTQVGAPRDTAGECIVALVDGSSVSGKVLKLEEGQLTVAPQKDVQFTVPWKDVATVVVRSDRMAFVSDLSPVDVRQRPILLSVAREWQRDRNVRGGPLQLGTQTFSKGIGVQPISELVFARGERFDTFAATVGIDASAQYPGAECEFVVLGDGKPLARKAVRRGDPPHPMRVDISGARQVTLLVESNKGLGISAHANWCDARFLRASAEKK
jgi:hypothetical protein